MSLTISEILSLPGLEPLTLRGGALNVHRAVRGYYMAENEGIAEWIMGGELVFVTGINLPRYEENLLQLMREGHQRGIAGMVILTGETFIHAIPDAVVALADTLGIPLIEQPYSLKMVIVTQLIGTALVQREATLRSQRDILIQLLTGEYPSLAIADQRASHLHLALEQPRRIAALRLSGTQALFNAHDPVAAEAQLQSARQQIQQQLETDLARRGHGLPLIVLGELFILLLPDDDLLFRRGKQQLQQLQQTIDAQIRPLRLFSGISSTVISAAHYRQGLIEARRALDVTESMLPDKGQCDYSELGVLKLLTAVKEPELVTQFMKETLGMLFEPHRKHPHQLVETLDAVLQENGNLIKAAERLHIHRNTLHQRLQRIEQQSGNTLNDPQFRLNASVALLIWRMSNALQQELL
ncbi:MULTISPECIES: PucR family transcriptional regulator [Lonsdalea]|uniref:Fis family transcriptional regulator n=2 Tax=Lonsdalea TaxID=1082702 RepID=A0ACD1JB20_9GAMM|nr:MULTISPECIES: PucR family transcriptional regulator [Lonsdalea]OSN01614.1 Fis family transcriptional regulator [Lonsdalea populi]QPQ24754.1 PucR family transcriptional regulator [Lonsdalea populi]RAT12530.1 Fis family transcriptional regulator [Lonsdalea quercina]RAT15217.1 Fis family transcriptional regulator [Lonsdalea quercina]RAT20468.1 Fis family transcriptional regulator [Lonsdalea populi]